MGLDWSRKALLKKNWLSLGRSEVRRKENWKVSKWWDWGAKKRISAWFYHSKHFAILPLSLSFFKIHVFLYHTTYRVLIFYIFLVIYSKHFLIISKTPIAFIPIIMISLTNPLLLDRCISNNYKQLTLQ